jgi:hypothetical protein
MMATNFPRKKSSINCRISLPFVDSLILDRYTETKSLNTKSLNFKYREIKGLFSFRIHLSYM